jgi:hypothetical protein
MGRTPGYRAWCMYARVPVFPFLPLGSDCREPAPRMLSFHPIYMRRPCNCGLWALSGPGGLVLTARADQLPHMPLIYAVAADQHVLNMAK